MRNLANLRKRVKFIVFVAFPLSFFAFGWFSHSVYYPLFNGSSTLDEIKRYKVLNVVLLNAPSTYYIGANGPQGFEYDLLKDYAKHLGVKLKITSANTIKEAIELSKNEKFHITSAALAKTPNRMKRFNFGPSYFEVQEQVICNRNMIRAGKFPRAVEDLEGLRISVGEDTSYSETIRALQEDGFDINASLTSEYSTEELLEQVANHTIDCTLADSNIYSLNQRYFTEIAMAFTISGREQLAWVLTPGSKNLEADMYSWLNSYNQSGKMAELKDHYYSHILYFDYYDTKMFYKRIKTRLPKYEKYFKEVSKKHDIPWSLIAAQSYQESHWNPRAKSFTGVRGLMMLTRSTAKHVGVKNRLDPKQSIIGGTKHLKKMIKSVPSEVEGENRLKFALAAYNIGMGHIKDAQVLATKFGLDKNVWSDLKTVLPLLSQKRYYRSLRFGYARGSEPVRYVESIYDYKDILENSTIEKEQEAGKINTTIKANDNNFSNVKQEKKKTK
ncbi:MAG: membrane-bound lytic murein transglycosylase MltF [Thiovulaceae bacterium]|nr:membrane-bound lytic murein transglycosylase MltF [Sulfurimonadaceae bacterium]